MTIFISLILEFESFEIDGASTVVVEDDEKADGVRVVETGSVKPLKPVVQSASNNQQQQDQQQPAATSSQAQQPLSTDNANNAQTSASGQPLTVQQQSGQQPPVRRSLFCMQIPSLAIKNPVTENDHREIGHCEPGIGFKNVFLVFEMMVFVLFVDD